MTLLETITNIFTRNSAEIVVVEEAEYDASMTRAEIDQILVDVQFDLLPDEIETGELNGHDVTFIKRGSIFNINIWIVDNVAFSSSVDACTAIADDEFIVDPLILDI